MQPAQERMEKRCLSLCLRAQYRAAGHKGANRKELAARYGFSRVKFEEDARFAGYDCDVKIIL